MIDGTVNRDEDGDMQTTTGDEMRVGQRVSVAWETGIVETGVVVFLVEGQVHVRFDDGTRCWAPRYSVSACPA